MEGQVIELPPNIVSKNGSAAEPLIKSRMVAMKRKNIWAEQEDLLSWNNNNNNNKPPRMHQPAAVASSSSRTPTTTTNQESASLANQETKIWTVTGAVLPPRTKKKRRRTFPSTERAGGDAAAYYNMVSTTQTTTATSSGSIVVDSHNKRTRTRSKKVVAPPAVPEDSSLSSSFFDSNNTTTQFSLLPDNTHIQDEAAKLSDFNQLTLETMDLYELQASDLPLSRKQQGNAHEGSIGVRCRYCAAAAQKNKNKNDSSGIGCLLFPGNLDLLCIIVYRIRDRHFLGTECPNIPLAVRSKLRAMKGRPRAENKGGIGLPTYMRAIVDYYNLVDNPNGTGVRRKEQA